MTADPILETTAPPPALPDPIISPEANETVSIARAAGVIGLGNITSRVLGLVREIVKSHYFGAGSAVDAFSVATIVPTMLHDLLIGGMLDSALIPVFSQYVKERKDQLWPLVSTLLSITVVALAVFILAVELFSVPIAQALNVSGTRSPEGLALTVGLMRITTPAVLFMSLAGVLSALLYAFKRFSYPAFTAAVFNAGIVLVTVLFHRRLDITAMALGWLAGALLQVALLLPGLRHAGFRLQLSLWHPGLAQIALLYMPILLGLIVEIGLSRPISYALASGTGVGGLAWMSYATILRQLPQGLVGIAISFAVLPTLSARAAGKTAEDAAQFRATLAKGLRLVIVLIIPATVGLFILGRPTVDLLFEHGDFTSFDTQMTTWALYFYLLGLPFAAIDLLLIFAFYARQNTLTPALIGVGTNIAYLIVAAVLIRPLGLFALMLADSFKQLLHAAVCGVILRWQVGGLSAELFGALWRTTAAVAVMALATGLVLFWMSAILPAGGLAELFLVAGPGLAGGGVYLAMVTWLRIEEIALLWEAVRRRLGLIG